LLVPLLPSDLTFTATPPAAVVISVPLGK
jgi:hypothetical protein